MLLPLSRLPSPRPATATASDALQCRNGRCDRRCGAFILASSPPCPAALLLSPYPTSRRSVLAHSFGLHSLLISIGTSVSFTHTCSFSILLAKTKHGESCGSSPVNEANIPSNCHHEVVHPHPVGISISLHSNMFGNPSCEFKSQ